MTDDTNIQTNTGNGSAPLSKEASTRAQVQCLIKLAEKASEEAVRAAIAAQDASTAAHNVSIVLEKLAEYMDEQEQPTDAQRAAFDAFFKTECSWGRNRADHERAHAMVELWRKLHPGFHYVHPGLHIQINAEEAATTAANDDEIPF